jgi:hypothetical protein
VLLIFRVVANTSLDKVFWCVGELGDALGCWLGSNAERCWRSLFRCDRKGRVAWRDPERIRERHEIALAALQQTGDRRGASAFQGKASHRRSQWKGSVDDSRRVYKGVSDATSGRYGLGEAAHIKQRGTSIVVGPGRHTGHGINSGP